MRRLGFGLLGALAALDIAPLFPHLIEQPPHRMRCSSTYNRRGWGSRPVAGGGEQERSRRRRQIAAGSLKPGNGLDLELSARLGDYRVCGDHHRHNACPGRV